MNTAAVHIDRTRLRTKGNNRQAEAIIYGTNISKYSQNHPTSRSGTFLPCLPSPACVRQVRLNSGEDVPDNREQSKQASHAPTPQNSTLYSEGQERRNKCQINRHEGSRSTKQKTQRNTMFAAPAAVGGASGIQNYMGP